MQRLFAIFCLCLLAGCEGGPEPSALLAPVDPSARLGPPAARAEGRASDFVVAGANGKEGGATAVFADPNYRLRPLDLLEMQVHLEPDLATQARITKSGSIVLPLLGEVKVAGISLHEAEYKIERLYYERDFLQSPQVSLRILQYSPRQVQVLGMVNVPGPVPFPEEEDMTLSEALSMAGGINRIGNARKIRLTRSFPGGGRATARYNLNAILGDPQVEDIQLKPGDIIYVPEDPLGAYYGTQ